MVEPVVFYAAAPVFVIASLAMPAGIGGGLLYVPLLVVLGVVQEARNAAALGQPLIFGATLAAVVYNVAWQSRHPEKRLVNTEIALAAIPACLAGTMVGAVLNQVLPGALIHLLLLVVLLATLRNASQKALTMWRKESDQARTRADAIAAAAPAAAPPAAPAPAGIGASTAGLEGGLDDGRCLTTPWYHHLCHYLARFCTPILPGVTSVGEQARSTADAVAAATPASAPCAAPAPVGIGASSAGLEDGVDDGQASTGGSSAPRSEDGLCPSEDTPHSAFSAFSPAGGIDAEGVRRRGPQPVAEPATPPAPVAPPSAVGWAKLGGVFAALLLGLVLRGGKTAASVIGVNYCTWQYWLVSGLMFALLIAVELWTRRPEAPPFVCFLVGAVSAVVGMGGGVVLNPMLLGAGLDPMVVTATVTVMIVMVSSSTTLNFVLVGSVPVVPTLVLFCATFLGSLSGKAVVGWLVAKTGRSSILVFLLAGFIGVSACVVCVQGILSVISDASDGENVVEFKGPCER